MNGNRHIKLRAGVALLIAAACAFGQAPPATAPAEPEPRPILAPAAKADAARQLIDRFVAHVNASPALDAGAKSAVSEGWKQHRSEPEPEDFLTAGLAIISLGFKAGLTALEEEKYADADAALAPLLKSDDSYIALNAAVLQARSLVEQEKLEAAQRVLEPLVAKRSELLDKSFGETEVDFLLAYAQLSNLHYDEARKSLETFQKLHPDAPDRFRLPAQQMLQELMGRQPDSLGEVSDLMVYAGRLLANGEAGKPVEMKQGRAVELLARLIKQAEEQEKQQQQQNSGKGSGKNRNAGGAGGQPNSPANRSQLPGGKSQIGPLSRSPNVRPGEEWGKMRPEDRERVLQSLRKDFPSRYRQLVEQYYKQLAKEK